ncbi:hypothetical protein [Mucilaginibacter celer]|uniref:Uncharacterized protein n=1 Tax=Mucilaginibacter celer TaxID=2305508 RepID=A0A494VJR7_9SPHI|nr:hypothetical protein [Mucilaginibacter celer]AYL95316.1 hypothetical protein HYN43_008400 [Mucilaginibacter celer]
MKYVKTGLILWGIGIAARSVLAEKKTKPKPAPDPGASVAGYDKEEPRILPADLIAADNGSILRALYRYDNSKHRNLVHVRVDKLTVERLNKFKLATKVDMSKLIAFAVDHLFETQPVLITVIRNYMQNTIL